LTLKYYYLDRMKQLFSLVIIAVLSVSIFSISGCKKRESMLKVFVRDSANELKGEATVKISSDPNSNPETAKHSDIGKTNSSGFVTFNLETFFAAQKATAREGYFIINTELDGIEGDTSVRVTFQTTSVQTVFLNKK
jgi:hypothetical protein